MIVRTKKNHTLGYAGSLNVHSMNEIIVQFEEGDADSMFISELEVKIGDKWISLSDAIKDHDVITNNTNTKIFEPTNEEDRKRGYTL